MHYLVYKTTNKINDKIYIGVHKTKDVEDGYLGSGKLLKRAIRKYGKENFVREILFECQSSEEMFEKEKATVEIGPNSYNLKEGGFGGFNHLNGTEKQNKHLKKLASEAGKIGGRVSVENKSGFHREDYLNPNWFKKGNTNKAFSGKKHNDESKKKLVLPILNTNQVRRIPNMVLVGYPNPEEISRLKRKTLTNFLNKGILKEDYICQGQQEQMSLRSPT